MLQLAPNCQSQHLVPIKYFNIALNNLLAKRASGDPELSSPNHGFHLGGCMSVSIDTAALESNYRNMSDEEFASIRSQDLTPEALPVFERVALDRGVDVEAKTSLSAAKIQHVDTSTPRHRQMASHLDLISVASLILGGLCGLMGVLTLGGEKRTTALAFPIFLLPAALLIAGGVGIRLRAPWGRVVTLIGSILFIACPISWYVLWVMTRRTICSV